MKIYRILLSLAAMMMLGVSCKEKEVPEPEKKSRCTVIVYMAAENRLANYAGDDLREMLEGKNDIPLDCNLVVYEDNTTLPCVYTFDRMSGKSVWKTYPEQDSCDSLTFRNTLADIVKEFPAEHYGLVLWSHGSGWIPCSKTLAKTPRKTIGVDNNTNSSGSDVGNELEIPAMRRMLEQLGVHWDYIFFDACFMQCVEVDYELRNVCDNILASPAEIPGDGAPYHLIMSSLFAEKDAMDKVAQIYYNANKDVVYDLGFWGTFNGGVILSNCKTSEMENLARTMRSYIPRYFENKAQYMFDDVQTYADLTKWYMDYHDMNSAMKQLMAIPTDYEQFRAQLERTYPTRLSTPYWYANDVTGNQGVIKDTKNNGAVSMYFPHTQYGKYNEALHAYEWYKAAGWDQTGW